MFFMRAPEGKSKANLAKNSHLHLANERTFLAWIRTAIGIMADTFRPSFAPDIMIAILLGWIGLLLIVYPVAVG